MSLRQKREKKNGGDGEKSSSGQHASSLYSIHYCCYRLETADNVAGWHVVDVSFFVSLFTANKLIFTHPCPVSRRNKLEKTISTKIPCAKLGERKPQHMYNTQTSCTSIAKHQTLFPPSMSRTHPILNCKYCICLLLFVKSKL